jgi:outer membrane protein
MKKLVVLAVFCSLGFASFAQRFAHVDSQQIVSEMPQMKEVEKVLNEAKKSFEEEFLAMQKEYETKVAEYETKSKLDVKAGGWPEAIKQSKAQAIADHQQNMVDFQNTANTELQKIQDDQLQPLIDEFNKAVEKLAKTHNYVYVFDAAAGNLLYKGGDDITEKLRIELKIPAPAQGGNK